MKLRRTFLGPPENAMYQNTLVKSFEVNSSWESTDSTRMLRDVYSNRVSVLTRFRDMLLTCHLAYVTDTDTFTVL